MATLYTRQLAQGLSYTLQWRENGKRQTQSLGYISDDDAQIALHAKEIELLSGFVPNDTASSPFYSDYVDVYLKDCKARHCAKGYELVKTLLKGRFAKLIGDRRLDDVTKALVEGYQIQRLSEYIDLAKTKPVRPTTIQREINILKAFLNDAMANEVSTKYNLRYLKKLKDLESKPIGYFKPKEMEAIYRTAENPHWWKLLVNTGLRLAEITKLKWEHIDYDEGFIKILSSVEERTKSGKWRKVPINDNIIEALEAFKRIGTGKEYILPDISNRVFSDLAKRVIKKAGATGTTHKFRHTFCTMHVKAGTPTLLLQKLAGHAKSATTERYVAACGEDLKGINVNI